MLQFHQTHLRVIALLAISALSAAQSAPALARVDEAPSIIVRYHDLNLDNPQGIASLYGRIHGAAVDVCKSEEGPQHINRVLWDEWNTCINHAVAEAVRAVHNEKLSAYHWERIGGWRFR
jgi:UrcA family protein